MDEDDEHSPSKFYYPEDLETFVVETETGITECHVMNNLLTELARAVLENIGQYSPVRPEQARLVSGYYYMANPVLGKSLCSDWFFLGQDFAVGTVSMETVPTAKSSPRKNQSEDSDLPKTGFAI